MNRDEKEFVEETKKHLEKLNKLKNILDGDEEKEKLNRIIKKTEDFIKLTELGLTERCGETRKIVESVKYLNMARIINKEADNELEELIAIVQAKIIANSE